ncbi:MAG: 16S rRNA (uracil(1498)-N(3))-methyltransferase [Candidatus Omnitrophica bacterium]|nr:16S rRNA (uracil(1498)-N(3))-methyltransferase [Candidatus Omnitrophota bacterium]
MSRYYVPPESVDMENFRAFIDKDEAHHIIDVMRMKANDAIVVFDGIGKEYSGTIERIDTKKGTLTVKITKMSEVENLRAPEIYIAQAIPKKSKFDDIVEKATELGASGIFPVITERTIVRPGNSSGRTLERWRKIALEAAKQSGRLNIPEIYDVTPLRDLASDLSGFDLILFAWLSDGTVPLKEALKHQSPGKVLLMIGPEGDFTDQEALMFKKPECRYISLGRNVLKTDTAAFYLLSSVKYELLS